VNLTGEAIETVDTIGGTDHPIWPALDRVLADPRSENGLYQHGIGPIAAWRLRVRGEPVSDRLESLASGAAYAAVTAEPLLRSVRDAVDGPIIVLKGPETAALYPLPWLRPYSDLDLLVEDPATAERRLIEAGYTAQGPSNRIIPGHHHDLALRQPGSALAVELHRNPGWLSWMTPPSNEELFGQAVPSAAGVHGVSALPLTEHALLLAAHSWRHGPYHSMLHLVDIALIRDRVESAELNTSATAWGALGVWESTVAMIDWFFFGQGDPPRLRDRLWSRHLRDCRDRTLVEYYLATWLKGLAAPAPRLAIGAIASDVVFSFTPHPWQTRSGKIRRIVQGLKSARHPATGHLRR
jgi:Uncharacterised nucleotidyltransferase